MATELIVKVYADGTGHYTTLPSAVIAEKTAHPNLVTSDIDLVFEGKGDLTYDGAFIDLGAFTTDATHRLIFRPVAGHETNGVAGGTPTKYGTNTYILVCRGEYVLFDGFEVEGWANGIHSAANAKVVNCLFHGSASPITAEASGYYENCLAYDVGANTFGGSNNYRCTVVSTSGNITVMYRYVQGVLSQNVAYNTSPGNLNYYDTTNPLNDYNASDDTTAPGSTVFSVAQTDFEDYANNNFNISSSSPLYTAGVNGSIIGAVLPLPVSSNDHVAIVTVNIPSITASANTNYSLPVYQSGVNIQLPTIETSGTVTFNNLLLASSVTLSLPRIVATANADYSLPLYASAFTIELPAVQVSAIANYGSISYTANASCLLPSIQAASNTDFTLPVFGSVITSQLPSIQISSNIDYQLPVYQSVFSALLPPLNTSINTEILLPIFHALATLSLPGLTAVISYDAPYILPGCSIVLRELSTLLVINDHNTPIILH